MDLFKMANEIAKNMNLDDKDNLENMDMQQMISHVTKNVLGMMNNSDNPMAAMMNDPSNPIAAMMKVNEIQENTNVTNVTNVTSLNRVTPDLDESNDSDEDCIYPKTSDICFELNVDLEEFYNGKKKKLNVKRKRMIEINGKQEIIEEKKKLVISIEKGMKDEQQIRFEGEADQILGYKPGDIIITLIENEHPVFQRDNDNLIMIKNINLYQSYNYTFDIKHLDNNIYRISNQPSEALHLNDSIRKISSLGMPCYRTSGSYGDLFIRFNLVLPKSLSLVQLEKLYDVFKDDQLFIENQLEEKFDKSIMLENVTDTDLEDLDYTESESESDLSSEESQDSRDSGLSDVSESSGEVEFSKSGNPEKKMSLKNK